MRLNLQLSKKTKKFHFFYRLSDNFNLGQNISYGSNNLKLKMNFTLFEKLVERNNLVAIVIGSYSFVQSIIPHQYLNEENLKMKKVTKI